MNKHLFNIGFLIVAIVICKTLNCGSICTVLISILFIAFLTYGIFEIRFDYFLKSEHDVDSEKVILTFDDGPNPSTLKVVDVLKKHDAGAVFFLIGRNIEEYPQVMDDLINSGMVLGNHSYSHSAGFAFKSTSNICKELLRTEKLLGSNSMGIFRPPFGITSPQIARAVRKMGLKSIGWRVRSLDTVIDDKNKLIKKIVNLTKGGSIILLHETGKTTASCLDEMIINLKSSGLDIAKNDEIHKLLHA